MELTKQDAANLLALMERGIKAEIELHNAMHAKLSAIITMPETTLPPPDLPSAAPPGITG